MISKKLEEILRLGFVYSFFPEGNGSVLTVEPTENCEKVISSYRLFFNKQNQGFVVTAPVDESIDTTLRLEFPFIEPKVKLSFALFVNETSFYEQAFLPFDVPGASLLYFNNLNSAMLRTNLLTKTEGVKKEQRVPLSTKKITGKIINNLQPVVTDIFGDKISLLGYLSIKDNLYEIDLSHQPDGVYTITDSSGERELYCCKASFIRNTPLAVIDIYVDKTIEPGYQLVEYIDSSNEPLNPVANLNLNVIQNITSKSFQLHFGRFLYCWRYIILTDNLLINSDIRIVAPDSTISFSPQSAIVDKNHSPIVFTSTEEININDNIGNIQLLQRRVYAHCDYHHGCYEYKYRHKKHCHLHHHGKWINGNWKCHLHSYYCYCHIHECQLALLPSPTNAEFTYIEENGKLIAEIIIKIEDADLLHGCGHRDHEHHQHDKHGYYCGSSCHDNDCEHDD